VNIDTKDTAAIEKRLWDDIQHHQTGMLGITGGAPHHTQPMTAFVEPERGQIWFFTRTDTDLARQIGEGATAMFVYQQKNIQACIAGDLTLQHDPARIDKYWNAVVAAWYPDGKADSHLTLLCLDCVDAQVWFSEGGLMKFAWEIAKANTTHKTPDLGGHAHLNFH
jgi:general stress protein 26